jgi:hypothetical protein
VQKVVVLVLFYQRAAIVVIACYADGRTAVIVIPQRLRVTPTL